MTDLRGSALRAIFYGGLLAGSIDVAAASLINGISPMIILRAIASGLLGRAAFQGGLSISLLGLVLQWAMSLLIAAIFVVAARRMDWMRERWIAAGLVFGVLVFVVMNWLVVPLSAARTPHFTLLSLGENLVAMLAFGLIVSFFARRAA